MISTRTRKQRKPSDTFPWRSFFKSVLILCLLASSFFAANKIKQTQDYPIHNVKVYGAQHVDRQDVQHVLTPLIAHGFFAVDVDVLKEQLLQNPWVADVSVWRVWPDQIVVAITERVAAANWNDHGLLSSMGEIFTPDKKTYPENLPQFIGPDGSQIQMLENFTKMNRILQPLHNKIVQLVLTPYLSWEIVFDNGIKVNLGYKDVLTRISHFVKVYPKIVGERAEDVEYVDLRYSNGLAVKWKTSA